jgi:AcrR family transcriptional regulator
MQQDQSSANIEDQSAYQAARLEGQRLLQERLQDVASRLLVEEGYPALSMRRVAKEAGCSTMVLYNTFGGKEGLVNELYLEGFRRLLKAIEETPQPEDPLAYIIALCHTYRETALANPTHYAIMFERVIPDFEPSDASRLEGKQSMMPLIQAVQTCIDQGIIKSQGAEQLAMMLWAAAHGVVSLELSGYLPSTTAGRQMYERVIVDLLASQSDFAEQ